MSKEQIESRISFLRNRIQETEKKDGGNWNCWEDFQELCYLDELLFVANEDFHIEERMSVDNQ